MAQRVYLTALALLALVLLGAGACDLHLALAARATISDWLRLHPGWFWWPAASVLLFVGGLGVHLFWPLG